MKKIIKFFKKVIIFLGVIILLAALFAGVAIKNLDLNKFRPQIAAYLSSALSREVKIGDIAYEFSSNKILALKIKELTIEDDRSFSDKPMLDVESAYLDLDIISLVVTHKIIISKIEFFKPKFVLIKETNGNLNFNKLLDDMTLKDRHKTKADPLAALSQKTNKGESRIINGDAKNINKGFVDVNGIILSLKIKEISVTDGDFLYSDLSSDDEVKIPIKKVFLAVKDFSLNDYFNIELACSLFSNKNNIKTKAKAKVNVANRQFRIDDLALRMNLHDISTEKIKAAITSLNALKITDDLQGELDLNVQNVILGQQGVVALSSTGTLVDGRIQFDDIDLPISNVDMKFSADETNIDIDEISAYFASGKLYLIGKIDGYMLKKDFNLNVEFEDVQIEDIFASGRLPYKIQGKVCGKILLAGSFKDPEVYLNSIEGNGNLDVKEGKILGINIVKLLIDNISAIPDIGENIKQNLSEELKETISKKDTDVKEGNVTFEAKNNEVLIQKAFIDADGILISGKGTVDLDQNLSLTTAYIDFPKELSQDMVSSSKEFSYLMNKNKQIHFPLKPYTGKLSKFKTYPDLGDLGKKILKEKGKEELKKVIFKALDLGNEDPSSENPDQEQRQYIPNPEQTNSSEILKSDQKTKPQEILINNILDAIFK